MTDRELELLINEVEKNELIKAPKNMKEEVFATIRAKRHKAKVVELVSYRAKVVVGMAAAIGMLIIMPFKDISESRIHEINDSIKIKKSSYERQLKKDDLKDAKNEFVESILNRFEMLF